MRYTHQEINTDTRYDLIASADLTHGFTLLQLRYWYVRHSAKPYSGTRIPVYITYRNLEIAGVHHPPAVRK